MSMNKLLTIENVTKRYAAHTALSDVSLEVPQGSIYGLLGPNGAGKTSTIKCVVGIHDFDKGEIIIDGINKESDKEKTSILNILILFVIE